MFHFLKDKKYPIPKHTMHANSLLLSDLVGKDEQVFISISLLL